MDKVIFHIDMNSFFASCEQAVQPNLKGKPIIVGGDPQRRSGIVLAASYEAKRFGIQTTMPLNQAIRLCPEVIIIPSNFELYSNMSHQVMSIFDEFTPLKEQASIDEAFLDMTGTEHLFGKPIDAALKIQKRILDTLDLPCSVGISSNKLLAKMASEMKKPLGVTTLYKEEIQQKMWCLPVGDLYGVGKRTSPQLVEMGIQTIGDLANASLLTLSKKFGPATAEYMMDSAKGQGSSQLSNSVAPPKSIGNEVTFAKDICQRELLEQELLILADQVAYRLRKHLLKGKTVTIKIKTNAFQVITRSKTMEYRNDATQMIYDTACQLLRIHYKNEKVRLIGLTISHFDEGVEGQLSLFDTKVVTNKMDGVVDTIRNKFGYHAIQRASQLNHKQKELEIENKESTNDYWND